MAYFIFCLTTAIMASLFIFRPVMAQVIKNQPLNPVSQYSYISYSVFFMITILAAPVMFFSVIIPSFNERFKLTLGETLES